MTNSDHDRRGMHALPCITLCLIAFVFPGSANASFWPTNAEWAWWPEYCKAKHVRTSVGSTSSYASTVSTATITEWRNRLGEEVWTFVHHYCWGLGWLQRAQLETDERQRANALKNAFSEGQFTFERISAKHPMYAEIATHLGNVERERRDYASAIRYFQMAIDSHPSYAGGYQGIALVHRSRGDLDSAREVLLEADAATGGESPEINYFLGLILLDLKDPESSRTYARRAYEQGYPLPGLRNRLTAAGYPID